MKAMHVTYDPEADVMYLYLNDGREPMVDHSIELGSESEGLTADFDRAGHVVGLEVQFASHRFGTSGANHVLLELLTNGNRPAA